MLTVAAALLAALFWASATAAAAADTASCEAASLLQHTSVADAVHRETMRAARHPLPSLGSAAFGSELKAQLLQLHRGSGGVNTSLEHQLASDAWSGTGQGFCPGTRVLAESIAADVVPKETGSSYVAWFTMPEQQSLDLLAQYQTELSPVELPPSMLDAGPGRAITFSTGPAADVVPMMYAATKVSGIFERVPEELRGVFWMKGNGMPEELAVLQYSMWFDDETLLVQPQAPFMWAWPAGKPKNAPFFGGQYSDDISAGLSTGFAYATTCNANAFSFSTCREGGELTKAPLYCDVSSPDPLAYAYMQAHGLGNVSSVNKFGPVISAVTGLPSFVTDYFDAGFTLQKMPGSVNGSLYKRPCQWGTTTCGLIEFGSYDLVKIMDGEGVPLQPAYDDFLAYMGDVPLLVWSGWHNETAKELSAQVYRQFISAVDTAQAPPQQPHDSLAQQAQTLFR